MNIFDTNLEEDDSLIEAIKTNISHENDVLSVIVEKLNIDYELEKHVNKATYALCKDIHSTDTQNIFKFMNDKEELVKLLSHNGLSNKISFGFEDYIDIEGLDVTYENINLKHGINFVSDLVIKYQRFLGDIQSISDASGTTKPLKVFTSLSVSFIDHLSNTIENFLDPTNNTQNTRVVMDPLILLYYASKNIKVFTDNMNDTNLEMFRNTILKYIVYFALQKRLIVPKNEESLSAPQYYVNFIANRVGMKS